jgi:DNA-binding response OmpR family regulator
VKLLLVEDSPRLRDTLEKGLRHAGYAVDASGDGRDGLWRAQTSDYDVVILDWMLPGLDGLSLLKRLREEERDVRVLILTAKDAVADRVLGLESGADDYLVKPFAFAELLARVRSLCRRTYAHAQTEIRFGEVAIDLQKKTVRREGKLLDLTRREFMLLEYLVLRRGSLVSRAEIEAHIYDESSEPMSNVVDSTVYRLRKKLEVEGRPPLIRTQRGMGYMFEADA